MFPNDKYSLSYYSLIGKVKSVDDISYQAINNFGKIEKGIKKRESHADFELLFNENGLLIEETTIDTDGNMFEKWVFKHDNIGNIAERAHFNYKGDFMGKWTYTYNEAGFRIEKNWVSPHADLCKKVLTLYNELGYVCERQVYNHAGNLYLTLKYAYDDHGNRIEKRTYGSDDNMFLKHRYKYNKADLLTEVEWKDILGKSGVKENYVYDDKGQMVNKIISNYKSSEFDFVYNYDQNNHLVMMSWSEKRNNLIKNGHSEYHYDTVGNWVERIDYKNGMLQFLIERKIIYF